MLKKIITVFIVIKLAAWSAISQAQIVADQTAATSLKPLVTKTASEVPLVHIQTPNTQGVSHNVYSQFDVDKQGVILNNSRVDVQTQSGAWVPSIPMLGANSARLILNEVNSSNPSLLKGFIEVAGDRAQVVVANPSGITCDGCGFINASRATMTTGAPVFNGTYLDGYLVQGGAINIQGAGFNNTQVDYTDLIARVVNINGKIHAKEELKVTTGTNQVDAGGNLIKTIDSEDSKKPEVAIDVAALGGMYAGKITLVGTEHGVGVHNAGEIGAGVGEVTITVNGRLENAGRIEATQAANLSSSGLNNSDGVIRGSRVFVDSRAQAVDNSYGKIIATDLSGGALDIKSGMFNNDAGLIQAQGILTINTQGQKLSNTNSGATGGIFGKSSIDLKTGDLDNNAGYIGSVGSLTINGAAVNNMLGGILISESKMNLTANLVDNHDGQIQLVDDAKFIFNGKFNNSDGLLRSGGDIYIQANSIINDDTKNKDRGIEGKLISLLGSQISNKNGSIRSSDSVTLISGDTIDNAGGLISAVKGLMFHDSVIIGDSADEKKLTIENDKGILVAGQQLDIDSAEFKGDGQVVSEGDLNVKLTRNHTNTGIFQANGIGVIETLGSIVNKAKLLAGKMINLNAGSIDNSIGSDIEAPTVYLKATEANTITNRGNINAIDTFVDTVTFNNFGTGVVYGDHIAINATILNNSAENGQAPTIAARNRLDIGVDNLTNSEHGYIFSAGDLAIGGALDDQKHATGMASVIDSKSATIEALGKMYLGGKLINNTNNHFTSKDVVISKEANPVNINAGEYTFDYVRTITETKINILEPDYAKILSGSDMHIKTDKLVNDKSKIIVGGNLSGDTKNIENIEVPGKRTTTDKGTAGYWQNHKYRSWGCQHSNWQYHSTNYEPASTEEAIKLKPYVYETNTKPPSTGTGTKIPEASSPRFIDHIIEVAAENTADEKGQPKVIRSGGINLDIPDNSLFNIKQEPATSHVIETAPRFTNYRDWLSSDYMLKVTLSDHNKTHKRLGDGFYEQKLIREQVGQLTGRRFLNGYANDEVQYQALMDNGIAFSKAHKIRPGIELSAEQMAQLTNDIVWLVEKEIKLPSGEITKVLVPQVYVRAHEGDVYGSGGLISGESIEFNVKDEFKNSGTILGRSFVSVNAENIRNLGGRILGKDVNLQAKNDLDNIGGQVRATSSIKAAAGRYFNMASTTSKQSNAQGSRTNINQVAGLYVTGDNGILDISAGRDGNFTAAAISNTGASSPETVGKTTVTVKNNLNFNTIAEKESNHIIWNAANWHKDSSSVDVGTTMQTQGDVLFKVGNDLNAKAASVISKEGKIKSQVKGNINLLSGENYHSSEDAHQHTEEGFFSDTKVTTHSSSTENLAIGTTFSGQEETLESDKDINIKGSNVVGVKDVTLVAKNDINIEAATNTASSESSRKEETSGIFGTKGSLGFTIGTKEETTKNKGATSSAAPSTVGSTTGKFTAQAGGAYKQVASNMIALEDGTSITAKKVDIIADSNLSQSQSKYNFKQTGFTVAVTNPVASAIQTADQMYNATRKTSDARMHTLAGGATVLAAKNAYDAAKADPKQAGGINASLSYGISQSSSNTAQTGKTAAGSTVEVAGKLTVNAEGAGQDSKINITGSKVFVGGDAVYTAENDVNLESSINTNTQHSTNDSSSWSVGVSGGTGDSSGRGRGLVGTASGSVGRGNSDNQELTHTNTKHKVGGILEINTGGSLKARGAVVEAEGLKLNIGKDLYGESLQDVSSFKSRQEDISGSASAGYGSASVSANYAKEKMRSHRASVTEQTGFRTGDKGFQVEVKGNTDLKGAVITSTKKAAEEGKNSFTTGTFTQSDIKNTDEYDAQSISIGAGYTFAKSSDSGSGRSGVGQDQQGQATTGGKQVPGSELPSTEGFTATVPIALNSKDKAESVTKSGISPAKVTITDEKNQQELTGKSAAETISSINKDVSTEKDGANTVRRTFNKEKVQAEFDITKGFTREAATFIINRAKEADAKKAEAKELEQKAQAGKGLTPPLGSDPKSTKTLSDQERQALREQAKVLRTEADEINKNWGAGGTHRQVVTAFVGAVAGDVSGLAGKLVRNTVVNYIQQEGSSYIGDWVKQDKLKEGDPVHASLHSILACAGAAASNQNCGAAAMGGAGASLLTNLFTHTDPSETQSQREAKRNIITTLVSGIASQTNLDASTATNAAQANVDNNWLATQQIVQFTKEFGEAKGLDKKLEAIKKWKGVSDRQDTKTKQEFVKEVVNEGLNDAQATLEMLAENSLVTVLPMAGLEKRIKNVEAAIEFLSDQPLEDMGKGLRELRKELITRAVNIGTALKEGGDENARQLGTDLGKTVYQAAEVGTVAGGMLEVGVGLAKSGSKNLGKLTRVGGRGTRVGSGTVVEALDSSKSTVVQARVLENIAESQTAREVSNFPVLAAKETQILGGYNPDIWEMTTLHPGNTVYGGLPGQSAFYTDIDAVLASQGSKEVLSRSLQIERHPIKGYRSNVGQYEVLKRIRVPKGSVLANPKFGPGGMPQYYIGDYSHLIELKNEYNLEKLYEHQLSRNRIGSQDF